MYESSKVNCTSFFSSQCKSQRKISYGKVVPLVKTNTKLL